jgi:FHA domain-containing protein
LIRIEVTSFNGQPPEAALAADFDEMGGNIGRAEGNALVLPDPERLISRVHASVALRGGAYVIRDIASGTPVYVNGRALGNGHEAVLRAGDEIRIGAYTLRACAVPASDGAKASSSRDDAVQPRRSADALSAQNPFGDLITPAPSSPAQRSSSLARSEQAPKVSPRDAMSSSAETPPNPQPQGMIPEDFDPFALPPTPSSADKARLPDDFDPGLAGFTSKQSVDELFDLRAPGPGGLLATNGPLDALADAIPSAMPTDPLEAIGAVRPAKPTGPISVGDDVPEIYGSFRPPSLLPDASLSSPVADVSPSGIASPPRAAEVPTGAVDADVSGRSSASRQTAVPQHALNAQLGPSAASLANDRKEAEADATPFAAPASAPVAPAAPAGVSRATAPAAATPAASALADRLLREFLTGAGTPDLEMPAGLTPQLMNIIGQMLRESTQGTLDLLRARALLKRELRADVTMIAERENNPLKFSPDIQAAMKHLLAPQELGFMTPLRAMKDAHNDLRAHEFGFMAGMRAALAGVLARFNPEQLESRLAEGSGLDNFLPMNRKAKLWDAFVSLYQDLSREAEDDFHTLFGKEFLRAYAAQIAKLEEKDDRRKPQ